MAISQRVCEIRLKKTVTMRQSLHRPLLAARLSLLRTTDYFSCSVVEPPGSLKDASVWLGLWRR